MMETKHGELEEFVYTKIATASISKCEDTNPIRACALETTGTRTYRQRLGGKNRTETVIFCVKFNCFRVDLLESFSCT